MCDDYLIWYKPTPRSRRQKIARVVGDELALEDRIVALQCLGAVPLAVLRNGVMISRGKA